MENLEIGDRLRLNGVGTICTVITIDDDKFDATIEDTSMVITFYEGMKEFTNESLAARLAQPS